MKLTDANGRLCVCLETSDPNFPRMIENHYATEYQTFRLLDMFFDSRDVSQLEKIEVRKAFPGFYDLSTNRNAITINLPNAKPIKTTFRDIPRPKTRCETNYDNGHWWKATAKGWKRCDKPGK